MANQPTPRNGTVSGVFISPDHKGPRLFLRFGYVRVAGWPAAMIIPRKSHGPKPNAARLEVYVPWSFRLDPCGAMMVWMLGSLGGRKGLKESMISIGDKLINPIGVYILYSILSEFLLKVGWPMSSIGSLWQGDSQQGSLGSLGILHPNQDSWKVGEGFFSSRQIAYIINYLHQIMDLFWFIHWWWYPDCLFHKSRGFQRDLLLLSAWKPSVWRDSPISLLDEESKKDQERRWKTWSVSFFQSPLMKSHASLRPYSNKCNFFLQESSCRSNLPSPTRMIRKTCECFLNMFFLEWEHFFRCPKVLSFLETPTNCFSPNSFPPPRKQKGILLISPFRKETETETHFF